MLSYRPILLSVILIMVREISSIVPAPENISVSCHNLQTTVSWSYSKHLPATLFILNITGSTTTVEVETKDTHYDFSKMVKPLDAYFVEVSAVRGKESSISKKSQIVTFNDRKIMADVKCTLDFPPVNLTVTETETTVHFQNPYHFYKEMKNSSWRNDNGDFEYTIIFENKTETYVCANKKTFCKQDITLEQKRSKDCVILEGKRRENAFIDGRVLFRRTPPVCAHNIAEAPDLLLYLISFALGLSVFAIVVCVTVFMLIKVKACRMKSVTLPKLLEILPDRHLYVPYDPEDCVNVSELHISSSQHSLVGTFKETSESEHSSNAYGQRLSCSSSQSDQESETVETVNVQSQSLLSTEEVTPARSNYDRPQVLEMEDDMGNGDMVKIYKSV